MATRQAAQVRPRVGLLDLLSHLSYADVKKILGPRCDRLLREGGRAEVDLESHVKLRSDRLTVEPAGATATVRLSDARWNRLEVSCSSCEIPCVHIGAAFSLL